MDIDKILDEFPKKIGEKRKREKEERERREAEEEAQRDEIDKCFREIIRPALTEVKRKMKEREKDYYCEIKEPPSTSIPSGKRRYNESTLLFYPKEKGREGYEARAYKLIFKGEGNSIVGTKIIGNKPIEKPKGFGIKAIYKDEVESFIKEFISQALEYYENIGV